MRGLARLLVVAAIGLALSTAWDMTPTAQAALPPIKPPPIDPLPDPDPVDPPGPNPEPDPDPDHCHDTPEPATLSLLLAGGAIVGLRAWRRRQNDQ